MNIAEELGRVGLDSTNSVVIGSGIMDALGLRPSNDIDVTVPDDVYQMLKKTGRFTLSETHGREILVQGSFEVGTAWVVLGRSHTFADLYNESAVIDGVRYITAQFLLAVKERWLVDDEVPREKDAKDVTILREYLNQSTSL